MPDTPGEPAIVGTSPRLPINNQGVRSSSFSQPRWPRGGLVAIASSIPEILKKYTVHPKAVLGGASPSGKREMSIEEILGRTPRSSGDG